MEKEKAEDQINVEKKDESMEEEKIESELETKQENENKEEQTLEAKVSELEEKLVRLYAEMENQRRRYEKEREDAFEYGGFSLAKETLNLIDNLERSKKTIESPYSERRNLDRLDFGWALQCACICTGSS